MPRGMPLIVRFSPKSSTACSGRQRARLHPGRFLDGNEGETEKERGREANGEHFFRKPEAGSRRDLKTRARTEIVRRLQFLMRVSSIGCDQVSRKRPLSVNACIFTYDFNNRILILYMYWLICIHIGTRGISFQSLIDITFYSYLSRTHKE